VCKWKVQNPKCEEHECSGEREVFGVRSSGFSSMKGHKGKSEKRIPKCEEPICLDLIFQKNLQVIFGGAHGNANVWLKRLILV